MSDLVSRWKRTLRPVILAGAVLSIGWGFSGSTIAQHESPTLSQPHVRWFQIGRASWYGNSFQGQPTASGEAFDQNRMTCAHRSLPFGSLIRVTNLRNHRSVVVRVNDRGPQIRSRVVDLSYGAARILRFHGMTRVRLDLVDSAPTPAEVASLTWIKTARH